MADTQVVTFLWLMLVHLFMVFVPQGRFINPVRLYAIFPTKSFGIIYKIKNTEIYTLVIIWWV